MFNDGLELDICLYVSDNDSGPGSDVPFHFGSAGFA